VRRSAVKKTTQAAVRLSNQSVCIPTERRWCHAQHSGRGAVVTPQTVKGFAAWPVSIALVMVAAVCMNSPTAVRDVLFHPKGGLLVSPLRPVTSSR
jgi:hypothetical protein